jgi:hypothetical protein
MCLSRRGRTIAAGVGRAKHERAVLGPCHHGGCVSSTDQPGATKGGETHATNRGGTVWLWRIRNWSEAARGAPRHDYTHRYGPETGYLISQRTSTNRKGKTMLKLSVALAASVLAFALSPVANAQEVAPTTFVAFLSAENEVPRCPAGVESGASGVAIIQIDEATGVITYRVVATNLPGTIAGGPGAHIHVGAAGAAGPVVLPLELTGLETGLVAAGTATDPALAAAILANPANYYVNVHTTECPGGAIRGQLG